jgi:glycerophosphoryl diester phosphodiesterase
VTAITFAKASVAVQKGKKVSNPAIVTPTYAANKKVTYKSSSTSVATVSTSGVVTGKKVGTATITATAADGSKKKKSYKVTVVAPITKNSAKFIAHRGLSAKAPENTIKAYELAGGAGFWGAETDVRMTKDKKFILQHDLTFKRLCGVDKKPEDMTLSEIQKLTIKSGNNISKYRNVKSATTVATLEDYLTTCKKYNMVPVIEIKMEFVEYGNETTNDSRMQAVTKNNMEDLYALTNQIMGNKEYMFIAYDFETMVQMRKVLDDNATTSTNVKLQHVTNNPDHGMINYYKKRKIELDANCDKISLSDIKAFKDGGVNVGLWTVDDTERVADYIAQKVDYITTNTKFW